MSAFTDRFKNAVPNLAQEDYDNEEEKITGYIGDIAIDIIEEATPNRRWNVTKNKVSGRADMGDHRRKKSDVVAMTILITDDGETGRTFKDKSLELEEFADVDQLFELVVPWEVYPSMAIVGLDPLPHKDVGNAAKFKITMEEMQVSGVTVSDIDSKLIPKRRKAKQDPPKKDEPDVKKNDKPVSAGTKSPVEVQESWLEMIF